jgi:hypothetical protein
MALGNLNGTPRHVNGSRVAFLLAIVCFRTTLDLCYLFFLSTAFVDDPITPMPVYFAAGQYAQSWIALLVVASLVPFQKDEFSGVFFLAAMAFLYIPMTSMVGLNHERPMSDVILAGLAVLTSAAVVAFPIEATPRSVPRQLGELWVPVTISVIAVVAFVAWSIASGAIFAASASLEDIYLHRGDASETLDVGPLAYFNLWAQKVFNPFLLAVGLFWRRRLLVVGCIVLQIYFFLITQHRSHLFVPVMIFFMYFLYTRPVGIAHVYLLISGALLGVLAVANGFGLFEVDGLPSILIRRAFFVAASVTSDWLAYFHEYPHAYFADNLFKSYVENEYTGQNLPALMSTLIFDGQPFGFNVGIVGTGYAHLGLFGVLLYAATAGAIVRFVNHLIHRGLPAFLAAAILFEPFRTTWADTDLPTAILSHGILIGTILLCITVLSRPVTPLSSAVGTSTRSC